jgi:hypothetical protein
VRRAIYHLPVAYLAEAGGAADSPPVVAVCFFHNQSERWRAVFQARGGENT